MLPSQFKNDAGNRCKLDRGCAHLKKGWPKGWFAIEHREEFNYSMNRPVNLSETEEAIQAVLGYLNFSSGSHDPQFFQHLNRLYQYCDKQTVHATVDCEASIPLWKSVIQHHFYVPLMTFRLDNAP